MSAPENLWPEISVDEVLKNPKTILNEQAKFLAQVTKNLLSANVTTSPYNAGFIHNFEIIAPNLNGYKYQLLNLLQTDIFFYPCRVNFNGAEYVIQDEETLITVLRDIFNNSETNKVIKSLIAQSKSEVSEYV